MAWSVTVVQRGIELGMKATCTKCGRNVEVFEDASLDPCSCAWDATNRRLAEQLEAVLPKPPEDAA